MRAASTLVLAVLLCAVPLRAAAAWPDGPAGVRAILSITINKTDAGESVVILRDNAREVLVPASVLAAAGLSKFGRDIETVDGLAFQPLAGLAPKVTFVFDEVGLALAIEASPELFHGQLIDLRPHAPAGTLHPGSCSAFANYGVNWTAGGRPSLSSEIGIGRGSARLVTSVSQAGHRMDRGLTAFTLDQASALRRFSAGDFSMRGGPLWSAGLMSGAAVSREFSLDPYFIRFPTPRLSQTLTTPSTVDVYVNDRLMRRTELGPGVFDVTGIPALAGAGTTRIVVKDALGRSEDYQTDYYITSSVLSRGLQDFQYAVGARRRVTADGMDREPAVTLTHRVGVTDRITVGAHVEGDPTLVSGGPVLTARPGRAGEIEIALGASRNGAHTGRALSAAWAYTARRLSASASLRMLGAGFASFGDASAAPSARIEGLGVLSAPVRALGMLSLQLQQQWLAPGTDTDAGAWQRRAAIAGSRKFIGRTQLQWRAGSVWTRQARSAEASMNVSLSLGRTLAMASVNQSATGSSGDVMLSRSESGTRGVGYRARASVDGASLDGAVHAQNRFGRVELQTFRAGGATTSGMTISGGVVAMGNSLHFTSALGESYALVRVPGVAHVRVFANNVEVGRTDARGHLLVPNMIPNYANRLAIADDDLPGDRTIADAEKLIAPPVRGGAVVTFAQDKVRSITGTIVWTPAEGGDAVAPAFGVVSVKIGARSTESPIGAGGEFFLEQVPAGRYDLLIRYHGDSCTVRIAVPDQQTTITDIGRVACRVGA